MIGILAALCAGTFFGASIYINLALHPATVEVGGDFAGAFFPPMYAKASTLQITLAAAGTVLGLIAGFISGNALWFVGAAFLISVVPITLLMIKPINDQLLYPKQKLPADKVMALLKQWNPKHWIRSIVSFVAFVCFLTALSA